MAAILDPALLEAAEARARAAHPQFGLPAPAFRTHLERHLPPEGDALAALHVEDLYLACAAAAGDAAALTELDRSVLSQVPAWLLRFGRSPDFADEVRQELRQILLIGRGSGGPRLLDYSGHGPLARWVRVSAVRAAINQQRLEKPPDPNEVLDLLMPGPDPELDFIKLRDRGAVRTAVLEAIAALDPKDLGLLRMRFMEGVPLEKLAAVHRVHRATMVRWLAAARASILHKSRALLRERLKLTNDECDSLIKLVQSRLDASLARVFAAGD